MSEKTTERDEKSSDKKDEESGAFLAGIFIGLLVAGLSYLIVRNTDEELYKMAYSDAMKAATTCTEAMERVHEVCGSDKPSEREAPSVFEPNPFPN